MTSLPEHGLTRSGHAGHAAPGTRLVAAVRVLHELAVSPADSGQIHRRLSALERTGRTERACADHRLCTLVDYSIEHMELAAEVARVHEVIAVVPELAEILWITSACACRLAVDLAVPRPPLASAGVPGLVRDAENATARMLARWRRSSGFDTAQRELGLELETVLRSFERIERALAHADHTETDIMGTHTTGDTAARRTGAPRTADVRWRRPDVTTAPPQPPEQPRSQVVHQVLDFFEKCPDCGYPAEATETLRVFADGRTDTTLQPTCGLPCGWRGAPRENRGR
ncbi:hypothetical protein ACFVJ5_05290 [Nocardia sp. NPDC127606]|uniref:hypothetical protein n=1 Tax=Nocardia sp. NPDC127606 TaxID=3345406 RepID=UPI003637FBD0